MPSRFLQALGQRIRSLRAERGRSQGALAAGAGVDRAFLGRVERGSRNITVVTAARIANALDVDVGELLSGLPAYDPAEEGDLKQGGDEARSGGEAPD